MVHGWDERQQRTRNEVLDAVGALIAEGGVEFLTMRRLAERAGVAVATLYNQFGDREGVIVAYVGRGLDDLEQRLDAEPADDPIDATRAVFEALDATIGADPRVWQPVFAMIRSEADLEGLGAVGDRFAAIVEHDLAKASVDGRFVDIDAGRVLDTEELAWHLLGQRLRVLERWAVGAITWAEYTEIGRLGLELSLAALLRGDERIAALRRSGVTRAQ
ncbi:MAG: TetR/AcrR family transcriptional regulator [Ilumatobacteraceae bacterium]|nr:TetR/AcrR family transcriptional regulator [Ilumatobacteraceae bacterium]